MHFQKNKCSCTLEFNATELQGGGPYSECRIEKGLWVLVLVDEYTITVSGHRSQTVFSFIIEQD